MKKFFILLFLAAAMLSAQDNALKGKNIALFLKKGRLVLTNGKGIPMLFIDKLKLMWSPPVFIPEKAVELSPDRLEVSYQTLSAPAESALELKVLYTLKNENRLQAEYRLSASGNPRLGGAMQELGLADRMQKTEKPFKSGLWTRHAKGGVPFEVADGVYRLFQRKTDDLWLKLPGNPGFTNPWSEHIAFQKNKNGLYTASMMFAVLPHGTSPVKAAALFNERPAALEITTQRDFNLWPSGKPEFKVSVCNTAAGELATPMHVVVRDFDGRIVLQKTEFVKLPVNGSEAFSYTVPEEKRGIYFVEASMNAEGKEIFSRTNLAILPEHEYTAPDTSRIGMAAFFPVPSEDSVFRLMKRIGVRYLRNGDNRKTFPRYGIVSLAHSNVNPKEKLDTLKSKAEAMLDKFEQQENPAWEFGNEWNMKKKREEKIQSAKKYSDLVKTLAERKKQKNYRIKLLSMGVAGPDTFYLEQFLKNGIWNELDGIVIHPGRGHFTPDYDNRKEFWCYLGAIRKIKDFVKKNGDKPIYLSEVYAATPPNSRWNDSEREAANNILLTLALGIAEGMKIIEFYQMHDGVWFNHYGINHKNSEYHYGLLLRDGTPKPSLLAFAAAAEALDGAKFVRYLSRPGTELHGMLFDTPRGPMAIVYDRTDGFHQVKLNPKQLEPWVDYWKSKVKTTFTSDRKEVTVIDILGRAETVPVINGNAELELTGSPKIVYGLKF